MKLALLLFGLSKSGENYHGKNKSYVVDYEKSVENYKTHIYKYFEERGYEIDVYMATNPLSLSLENKLCQTYKPVDYCLVENGSNHYNSRNKKVKSVLEICINYEREYDLVLMTRFDLMFQKDFNKSNIHLDKFNLVSILEQPTYICDNFYLFPYKYIHDFLKIVDLNIDKCHHFIQDQLYSTFGESNFNYILNEKTFIRNLSFYKIVRNES